ncbi:MAG TPA: anti-sigma factor [Terriglobia bacterium]|nr:anti-sigma factor [Terriglobia bacterium]
MHDRRCKRIFAMLSEYLDGDLPVKNCSELERHLKGCEPCIAYLQSLKDTMEVCRRYRVVKAPPPSRKVREALRLALR